MNIFQRLKFEYNEDKNKISDFLRKNIIAENLKDYQDMIESVFFTIYKTSGFSIDEYKSIEK